MSTLDRVDDFSNYRCIDSELGEQLYDYYNGALTGTEAREAEAHLLICVACRSKVNLLDAINSTLKQELSREARMQNKMKSKSAGGGNPI